MKNKLKKKTKNKIESLKTGIKNKKIVNILDLSIFDVGMRGKLEKIKIFEFWNDLEFDWFHHPNDSNDVMHYILSLLRTTRIKKGHISESFQNSKNCLLNKMSSVDPRFEYVTSSHGIDEFKLLSNQMRLLLVPDRSSPVVTV